MSKHLDKTCGADRYVPGHRENTICEVHRKLYFLLTRHPDKIGEMLILIKEAFVMGKKMSNKLLQHQCNFGSDWYQAHKLDGGKLDENEF